MRLRRRLPVFVGLLLFLAAIAIVVLLRKHAPPEAARLLPGADGFVYANLQWMRRADVGSHAPEVKHDPEYERFIEETGFDFERDLAQAAIAVHYASPETGNQTRFSEVMVARVNGEKLRDYLKKAAVSVENFEHVDIYSIPAEEHVFRVAVLGVEVCTPHLCTMIAGSNHPDKEVIHGMIHRSHKMASPFAGPALLRQFYKRVPQLPLPSLGWAIFQVKPSARVDSAVTFPGPATVVASVQYLGDIHFRAEAFTKDDAAAQQLSLQANTFLKIFESAEISVSGPGPDPDFDKAMKSIQIQQKNGGVVVLTARVPSQLVHKLVAEAPLGLSPTGNPGK